MTIAFVVSETNWPIVEGGLPDDVRVAFVSHEPRFPEELIDHHQPRALVVESLDDVLTAAMVEEADRVGLVLAALITHHSGEQLALDRGVGHIIRQPDDLRALLSPQAMPMPPHRPHEEGRVVGVWGASGSPGRTTMTLTLGAMARARGFPIMLVDADPRGGTVASAWGLLDEVPGFLACTRLASKDTLNSAEVTRLTSRYDSNAGVIDVLTGVSRMMRESEAERDALTRVVSQLREMYPLTLVDVGSDLPSESPIGHERSTDAQRITSHLVGSVDHVVVVIDATPSGITRFARAHDDLRAAIDHDSVTYVLNGVDRSRRALGDEAIIHEALSRFAGLRDYVTIPRDDSLARQALTMGVSLVDIGSRSSMVSALEPVVDELCRGLPLPSPRATSESAKARGSAKRSVSGLLDLAKTLAPLR